ncbi:HAD family hydrolase [Staphylococcus felis]|uniref:HAD-IA family hydrolase n=1 Tax=Staphylococcus felis TaxID=46127 RepID=UPI000E232FAE|nr:HAD-IA family hydrolase [Staphylococcus felis]REI05834.1 HAD family hydrolase [Staphylococcus felis]REI14617.1 HAD family hydrolase [Staphylococcus felis]REI26415.1 HAD family hydrolase [Staphylococcus felis]
MYRAVIFDFDGTVIDTEQHLFEIINQNLTKEGHEPVAIDFFRSNIGGRALPLHHHLMDLVGEARVLEIYHEHHTTAADLSLRPGVLELIQSLHQRHIPIGIASSSSRDNVKALVQKLDLEKYISVIKGREDVEEVKPAPDLYLAAVQALHFNPTHCLAIEDSIKGATAAINAGLGVIVNTNLMTEVSDFSDLPLIAQDIDLTTVMKNYFNG